MISFEGVSFKYDGLPEETFALRHITMTLDAGEMLAVLGANGSGKSTLACLCNGLLCPTSGSVTVDGLSTSNPHDAFALRERIGMVFQNPDDQIVATTVEDDAAFGPENLGLERIEIRRRVDSALAQMGLTGIERREPHLLSGGQKQRLAIAGALAMQPRYLVLDEPMSMIDSQGRAEVSKAIEAARGDDRGVLLVTHSVAEATTADRVLVLDRGSIAFEGTPAELLSCGQLQEWGLELPSLGRLVEGLRVRGLVAGSPALTPSSVAEALCL